MRVEPADGLEVLLPQFVDNVPDELDNSGFSCSERVEIIDEGRVCRLHSVLYDWCCIIGDVCIIGHRADRANKRVVSTGNG